MPGPRGNLVVNNIRSLLNFTRIHSGTSNQYIQARNTMENSIGGATGILDSGIKRRKSKKIKSKKKRIKRKSKKRYCNK